MRRNVYFLQYKKQYLDKIAKEGYGPMVNNAKAIIEFLYDASLVGEDHKKHSLAILDEVTRKHVGRDWFESGSGE